MWLACVHISAQHLSDIRFSLLDETNGLSNHWVTDIAIDSSGYLWVGTYDGLNRYDGHTFKIFRHNKSDSTSLLSDYNQHIFVSPSGEIWLSYAEGGFSKFNKSCQCFTHYIPSKTKILHPPDNDFEIKFIDRSTLWYSGDGLGLNSYDTETGKEEHYDLPNITEKYSELDKREYNTVCSIYESPDGLLWLCSTNGLYSFNRNTKQFSYKPYPKPAFGKKRRDNFNKLIPEADRGFWIASWDGGMNFFDTKSEHFKNYNFEHQFSSYYHLIFDFEKKSEDEFWIVAADKGLCVFNKKTGTFHFKKDNKANESNAFYFLHRILVANTGQVFIADENNLLVYNPNSSLFNFKSLPIAASQHSNLFLIRKIMEMPERNETYFVTELGDGLNIMNNRTGKLKALPVDINPEHDQRMRCLNLLEGKYGKWWLLTRDFIYEFDYIHHKLIKISSPFKYPPKNNDFTFRFVLQDADKNLWVLMDDGAIYRFDEKERKLQHDLSKITGASIDGIRHIAADRRGNLWASAGNAIGYFDTKQQYHPVQDSVVRHWISQGIKSMVADTLGNIWIAANAIGLLKIHETDNGTLRYRIFSSENGLPHTRINLLGVDPNNNIWVAAINGAVWFNTQKQTFRLFNQSVGMDKFTLGMRFLRSNKNSFYITTPGKYCNVNLEELEKDIPLPKMYLDNFKVFNTLKSVSLDNGSQINLKPSENVFSFDFGCIDFSDQSHHRFAYMLEGWDKNWIECGSRRFASYTNLGGGHYIFRVKASNSEGMWSEPISVSLFIATPFYKKTWFIVLISFVLAALIYTLYLFRIRQIEKTEKLKTEFNRQLVETRMEALRAQMNPHFIFNCLNSINRYIIKSDVKTSSLYLTRFAKLIRLILDNSKHKYVVLANELEALRLYVEMEALRFDHKFTFTLQVDENIDTDNIEIPPLIIQPYVENAIWHGLLNKESDGHLLVKISMEEQNLVCEITDNGIGRIKAAEYKSRNASTRQSVGMKLTEERLAMSGGNSAEIGTQKIVDLFDEKGKAAGTQVILTIPV